MTSVSPSRRSVRSDVDFVLTFEEVMGMFEARNVRFEDLEEGETLHGASGDGRRFAISGGVAQAVASCIAEKEPGREVRIERAEGLDNCRKMLMLARAGKYNGYLLEGMACPGGCVGGVGTIQPISAATAEVKRYVSASPVAHAYESDYKELLPEVEE